MAWTGLEHPELGVRHLLEPEPGEVRAFRAIELAEPTLRDFSSAYVIGHPRPRRIQLRSAPIWMAVSMTTTREATEDRIRWFPKIGTHVAELVLPPGQGIAYAETVEPGHLSVWGDPFKLAKSVVDVYPVE